MARILIAAVSAFLACGTPNLALAQSPPATTSAPAKRDPRPFFARGEDALARGDLDVAERSFHRGLAIDPKAVSGYVNLGVIAMRRQQWPVALENFRKAEKLAPTMAGI